MTGRSMSTGSAVTRSPAALRQALPQIIALVVVLLADWLIFPDFFQVRLQDGRLCLTYGYRAAPFGIRARLSVDDGKTWGPDLVLRNDGGGRDIGYPRTVQRPDGKVVTIYYFHDTPKGNRYIGATIWDPDKVTGQKL